MKRAKEYAKAVERVVSELVGGLRSRFKEVVEAIYAVIFQFRGYSCLPFGVLGTDLKIALGVLPQLFQRFFDSNPGAVTIHSPATQHAGSESPFPVSSVYTIPKEVLQLWPT